MKAGRIEIKAMYFSMADGSWCNFTRPECDQWNPNATLGQHSLITFEWSIMRVCPTVVGSEKYDGVLGDTVLMISIPVGVI